MSLESATYVSQLSATNPTASDFKSQGDDHIRLIKATLQATFPNASRAFRIPTTTSLQTSTVTISSADDGKTIPANAEAGALQVNLPAGSGLPDGFCVRVVKADHTNNLVTVDANGSETINGALTSILYQRWQNGWYQWSASLSAWFGDLQYVPPIGEVTPWTGADACPSGWLFPNGTTIGDASSGAAQRANVDCQGLFYHCWTQFSNTVCAVSGGRGLTAAADWAAHKTLALPNLAGDTWVGLDTLGGISDAGRLTASANGANTAGATNGEQIGSESNTLALTNLPSVTPTGTISSTVVSMPTKLKTGASFSGGAQTYELGQSTTDFNSSSTDDATTHLHTFTGNAQGGGQAHANVQPSFVGAWKIKL